jgi:hypothetical protein
LIPLRPLLRQGMRSTFVYSHPTLPQAEKRAVLTYLLVYIDELLEALPSEEERD